MIARRSVLMAAGLAPALALPIRCPAAAERPLRVGVLTDMSSWGHDNSGSGSVVAARMAAEEMGGAVGGRPVEILAGDHQMKTDIGVSIARDWIDNQGVTAIADVPNSAIGLAISGLAKDKGVVALLSGPGAGAITNERCNANTVQFTYDTYALAHVTGSALVAEGARRWFFITADYAFGHQLEKDASAVVSAAGGAVLGHALHPTGTSDFSSALLAASSSGADVVALANAGLDTDNALKQAAEFGIGRKRNGQRVAALLMFISDVHAVGLDVAQGAMMTTASYWDLDDATRAWSRRFFAHAGMMPTMIQTGSYGAVLHYLRAAAVAGTEAAPVMAAMRAAPINDVFVHDGRLRQDGRVIRDMYLTRVKAPAESKGKWDYLEIVRTIPGKDAVRPAAESAYPLLKA